MRLRETLRLLWNKWLLDSVVYDWLVWTLTAGASWAIVAVVASVALLNVGLGRGTLVIVHVAEHLEQAYFMTGVWFLFGCLAGTVQWLAILSRFGCGSSLSYRLHSKPSMALFVYLGMYSDYRWQYRAFRKWMSLISLACGSVLSLAISPLVEGAFRGMAELNGWLILAGAVGAWLGVKITLLVLRWAGRGLPY